MIKGAQLGRNRKGKPVLQRVSMKYGVGTERGAGVRMGCVFDVRQPNACGTRGKFRDQGHGP
jgi:hypothetical protein